MSEWIACSDKLPDESVPVWVIEEGTPYLAAIVEDEGEEGPCLLWARVYGEPYYVKDEGWKAPDIELDDQYTPSLWMALPDLPEPPHDHDD